MMNICIVTGRYPYNDNMEFVFVKKIVDEWAKKGHHCYVITVFSWTTYLRKQINYKPPHYKYKVSEDKWVDVYNPRILTTKIKMKGVSIDLWTSMMVVEHLLDRLNIYPDFFYCHFFKPSLFVFRFALKKSIPFFVATGESKFGTIDKPYYNFNWKDYCTYTKGVISVSTKNKKEASDAGLADIRKCKIFPNGTDLIKFKKLDRLECRKKLSFPENAFIIICVGYFIKRKGQDRLLAAVKQLNKRDIKLIFVGSLLGDEDIILEDKSIIFKGTVDNNLLPYYYNAADVFCLPTLAEGCCNAIIEAMACGLPIISSNLPFNWDILHEHNSILVNPHNIEEISTAIFVLYKDANLRKYLGNQSYNDSQKLSLTIRAENILNYISSIIHK